MGASIPNCKQTVRRFEESAKRLGVRSISQKELNCVSIPRSSTVRIHACESAALSSRPGGFGFELRSAFGVSPTLEFVGRQKERTAMSVLRSVPAISAFSTLRFTLTISTMPSSVHRHRVHSAAASLAAKSPVAEGIRNGPQRNRAWQTRARSHART